LLAFIPFSRQVVTPVPDAQEIVLAAADAVGPAVSETPEICADE